MKCPECGHKSETTHVREVGGNRIRRYHRCLHCKHHFSSTAKVDPKRKKKASEASGTPEMKNALPSV
jgi:transcriptional regulator NrdR family protein